MSSTKQSKTQSDATVTTEQSQPRQSSVPLVDLGRHCEDVADLARLYRESVTRIEQYERLVNDGQELPAALAFGSFLIWSGVVSLCRRYAQAMPKIDGDFLRWKAEELQRQVREKWNDHEQKAKLDKEQIAGINRRLDVIAAQISRCHVYCPK